MHRFLLDTASRVCFAPEGGSGGGGDGGQGGGDGSDGGQGGTPQLDAKMIQELHGSIGELGKGIKDLLALAQSRAQQQEAARNQSPAEEVEGGEEEQQVDLGTLDEATLETLPRRQLIALITGSLGSQMSAALKPLQDQLHQVALSTTADRIAQETNLVASQHADFWEYQQEMLALAKENPTLGPRRLYMLAKAENPKKGEEFLKKSGNGGDEGGKSGDGQGGARRNFGGMFPSGTGRNQATDRRMKPRDAAEAAWQATVEALGGEPDFGE